MAKKEEGYNISDTGNWNVAADYSKIKIMKNLYLADEYTNIAIFGFSSFLDEIENQGLNRDQLKIKGFERLIQCLIMLIDNSIFAIKKGGKEDLEKHRENLKVILNALPGMYKTIQSQRTKTKRLKIDDEKFNKALDIVLKIKTLINEPLNKNHLIFTDKEEFDPQAWKEQIKKDATTRG